MSTRVCACMGACMSAVEICSCSGQLSESFSCVSRDWPIIDGNKQWKGRTREGERQCQMKAAQNQGINGDIGKE